jgi:DNA-directed RNA polymerase subunit RPC12/RpoP
MPFDVKCPDCGSELEAPDEAAGKKVKCPDCGARIPVPPAPESIRPMPAPPSTSRAVRAERQEDEDEDRPRRRRRGKDEDDEDEWRRRRGPRRDDPDDYDDGGVSTLIPYKNARALAAYYCGVFSLIPCLGLILGPIALTLGIMGLRYVGAHPKARGTGHAWAGIILGGLTTLANWGLLLIAVVGGFAANWRH